MQSVFSEKSEFNNYLLLWNISYIFILKLQVKMLTFNFSSLPIRNHSFSSCLLLQFFCQFSKHYGKLGSKGVTKYEKFYVFKGFVCY